MPRLTPPELIVREPLATCVAEFALHGDMRAPLDRARAGSRGPADRDNVAPPHPSRPCQGDAGLPGGGIVPQGRFPTLAVTARQTVQHLTFRALKFPVTRQQRPTGTAWPRKGQGLQPTLRRERVTVFIEDHHAWLRAVSPMALEAVDLFPHIDAPTA